MKMDDALFEASREPHRLGARRPTWNDESWMALYKGRPLIFIGGKPSPDCLLYKTDTEADDWQVFVR